MRERGSRLHLPSTDERCSTSEVLAAKQTICLFDRSRYESSISPST